MLGKKNHCTTPGTKVPTWSESPTPRYKKRHLTSSSPTVRSSSWSTFSQIKLTAWGFLDGVGGWPLTVTSSPIGASEGGTKRSSSMHSTTAVNNIPWGERWPEEDDITIFWSFPPHKTYDTIYPIWFLWTYLQSLLLPQTKKQKTPKNGGKGKGPSNLFGRVVTVGNPIGQITAVRNPIGQIFNIVSSRFGRYCPHRTFCWG